MQTWMQTWDVHISLDDGSDTDWTLVEAETIEEAARLVWDKWHETAWAEACITRTGTGDWGVVALDAEEFNFTR